MTHEAWFCPVWLNGIPNHKLEGYEILEDVQILYEGNENIREKSKAKTKQQ